jgi:pimeloyl-ACP methyl ester carboxylesterase
VLPVLLVHASGFSSRQWKRLAAQLPGAVAPDLIGYGAGASWPEGEPFHFTLDLLRLEALLDDLGPAHLIGHSYGGLLAALLAMHRPRLVRSLIVYEPVIVGILRSRGETEALAALPVLPDEPGEAWMRAFVDWWNEPGAYDALPAATRAGFLAVGGKVFGEVTSLGRDETPHQAFATIQVPALVLGGSRSPRPARRIVELLGETLPHGEARVLDGMGHMGPLTHAEQVNGEILGWLRARAPA